MNNDNPAKTSAGVTHQRSRRGGSPKDRFIGRGMPAMNRTPNGTSRRKRDDTRQSRSPPGGGRGKGSGGGVSPKDRFMGRGMPAMNRTPNGTSRRKGDDTRQSRSPQGVGREKWLRVWSDNLRKALVGGKRAPYHSHSQGT